MKRNIDDENRALDATHNFVCACVSAANDSPDWPSVYVYNVQTECDEH